MINLLIAILLAISTGTACDMGDPADYYAWVDANPDYNVPMTLNTDEGDYWLMEADGTYYLFKFADDDALDGAENQHGACFRMVGNG